MDLNQHRHLMALAFLLSLTACASSIPTDSPAPLAPTAPVSQVGAGKVLLAPELSGTDQALVPLDGPRVYAYTPPESLRGRPAIISESASRSDWAKDSLAGFGQMAPPAPEMALSDLGAAVGVRSLTPAAQELASRAEQQRQSGDYPGAAATLERALRIQPREAYLWNRLARVRLEQGLGSQASNLAARSNNLAGNDQALKRNNWDLIATVRRQNGDFAGAREAERLATGATRGG